VPRHFDFSAFRRFGVSTFRRFPPCLCPSIDAPRRTADNDIGIGIARAMRQAIERVCRDADYEPPVICTPEELTNDDEG